VVRTGSTTFRHTKKALEKWKAYMKKHGVNKSLAINQILEAHELNKPQLEQKEGENFFEYPPFLYCPSDRKWFTKDSMLTGQCKNCLDKKGCPAWVLKAKFL